MADGGDTDLLPRANEVDDHPRARERLAGAGWSLDGEDTAIEGEDDPTRAGDGRFPGLRSVSPATSRGFARSRRSRAARCGPGPSIP